MDELELLKKDWQRNNLEYPKLSKDDIYNMSHAKSSSIVKWIFYIGLIEFAFWFIIAIALKGFSFSNTIQELESSTLFIVLAVVSYVILFYFLYRFYINYKTISATDSARQLMKKILKTRQTVKHYVLFNLIFLIVATFYGVFYAIEYDENTHSIMNSAAANGKLFEYYAGVIIATVLILALVIGVLLIFYWLIYGILLKRLNRNYRELKRLEV